ncbi:MAG: class I SAM-dependent methyltransferase [Thermoplasmatota archaeon]
MSDYKGTIDFWNGVFKKEMNYDKGEPIPVEEIEKGLNWLAEKSGPIIDFGCGNGKLVLRSLALGSSKAVGIDISSEAISTADKLAKDNGLTDKTDFIIGGVSSLSNFKENEFDAGIISNVLDNLFPDDAKQLLNHFHRIIRQGGRVLLKLNDYIEPRTLKEWGAKEISDNFYKEDTGLYFWNLTDEEVENLVSEYFDIERNARVNYEEYDQVNRLYYLVNR